MGVHNFVLALVMRANSGMSFTEDEDKVIGEWLYVVCRWGFKGKFVVVVMSKTLRITAMLSEFIPLYEVLRISVR